MELLSVKGISRNPWSLHTKQRSSDSPELGMHHQQVEMVAAFFCLPPTSQLIVPCNFPLIPLYLAFLFLVSQAEAGDKGKNCQQ